MGSSKEKTSSIAFNFCPNCGEKCDESSKFCETCGNSLHFDYKKKSTLDGTKNITFSAFFEKISPTKQRLSKPKNFINNNIELTVLLGVIVLLLSLASFKWGILAFCLVLISYYLWSVLKDTEEVPLNIKIKDLYQSASKQLKEKSDTLTKKATITSTNVQESSHNYEDSITHENVRTVTEPHAHTEAQPITSKSVKSQNKTVRLGISGLLLIISSGISLYGLLGGGFFIFSDANLSQIFSSSSNYLNYFEQMDEYFTGSSEENSIILYIIGKALIILPILVILFTLIPSVFGHLFALLFSLVELVLIFFIAGTIGDFVSSIFDVYSDNFFTLLFEYGDEVVGLPAFALIFGVIGMVIFSICKILSNLNRY